MSGAKNVLGSQLETCCTNPMPLRNYDPQQNLKNSERFAQLELQGLNR